MYKILIVDDEPLVARALARAMARQGFEVAVARHAANALFRVRGFAPDVVISDFHVPGMNGLEFMRQIALRAPRAARVLVSGCAEPDSPAIAYAAAEGCRFVRKPWDNKQLAALLRDILERRDAGSDAGGAKHTSPEDG